MKINYGVFLVLGCLLIVLSLAVAHAVPVPAPQQMSLEVPSDLLSSGYDEPPEMEGLLPKPKTEEEEIFDDNEIGEVVLEGFDEGSGEDCDKLPYGPTTQAGEGRLTPGLVFGVPISLLLIQLLS
ncbi:uncharacterized protein LOC108109347 [Drosophila eugracilis]|uniref:uncharacterized protein LOC108109347 n=1 Tax=Drosophila eugracilis TaxID=29029 RepID=UPI001BDA702E|nr:uncharacterized protein LOC108109347 [Drosophila eugracilis]